jgi:hypothetical protein
MFQASHWLARLTSEPGTPLARRAVERGTTCGDNPGNEPWRGRRQAPSVSGACLESDVGMRTDKEIRRASQDAELAQVDTIFG